jgi:hypothetical protein
MTRDEAIVLLKGRLTRSADTALDASILLEMRFAQEQILEKLATLPWFLISDELALVTVASTPTVAVPTNVGAVTGRDFLREIEDEPLQIQDTVDGTWSPLVKDDLGAIRTEFGDEPSTPKKYALVNNNYVLRPIPDAVYNLKTRVYLRDPRLTTNIENNWLLHAADLLIAETGILIADNYLRDSAAAALFRDAAATARIRLPSTHEARAHAGRNYSMGGDDN